MTYRSLFEKTLYHGSTIDKLHLIKKDGLVPVIGEFIVKMYSGSTDGDIRDYLEELVFATDKAQLAKAKYAIIGQIAIKLKKDFVEVTDDDFRKHGILAVIKNAEDSFNFYSEDDDFFGEVPIGVESGDYYSKEGIYPDYILIGKKLTSFFRKFGLYPLHRD